MTLTRRQAGEKAYKRIIENLLGENLNGAMDTAFIKCLGERDVRLILILSDKQINTLAYNDGESDKFTSLPVQYKNVLRLIQGFYQYRKAMNQDINSD